MNEIWTTVIGIFGVIIGAGLNELLRRKNRIETYSPQVFEIRLEKYNELMHKLQAVYEVAADIMENPKYSAMQRQEMLSTAILDIAEFTDMNELYIEPDLGAHCVATFIGAEEIQQITDPKEREHRIQEIHNMYTNAKRMIRENSGIAEIEKLFKGITKATISSNIIDRIRYLRNHPNEIKPVRNDNMK